MTIFYQQIINGCISFILFEKNMENQTWGFLSCTQKKLLKHYRCRRKNYISSRCQLQSDELHLFQVMTQGLLQPLKSIFIMGIQGYWTQGLLQPLKSKALKDLQHLSTKDILIRALSTKTKSKSIFGISDNHIIDPSQVNIWLTRIKAKSLHNIVRPQYSLESKATIFASEVNFSKVRKDNKPIQNRKSYKPVLGWKNGTLDIIDIF